VILGNRGRKGWGDTTGNQAMAGSTRGWASEDRGTGGTVTLARPGWHQGGDKVGRRATTRPTADNRHPL